MAYKLVQEGVCVFHITHIKNIPPILKQGIHSFNAMAGNNLVYQSIAHDNIQTRRRNIPITCGVGGMLHDYVPLYFGARSPMLCAVRYKLDQREIVHVAVTWNVLTLPTTVFTDGNAATHGTRQFSGIENLKSVDWEGAAKWYWADDDETRRKKSAEVLVHRQVTIDQIVGFFVMNVPIKEQLDKMVTARGLEKPVLAAPEFYY